MNWAAVLGIFGRFLQLRISFIGWRGNASRVLGKAGAKTKLLELSVALLSFGVRLTLRF